MTGTVTVLLPLLVKVTWSPDSVATTWLAGLAVPAGWSAVQALCSAERGGDGALGQLLVGRRAVVVAVVLGQQRVEHPVEQAVTGGVGVAGAVAGGAALHTALPVGHPGGAPMMLV